MVQKLNINRGKILLFSFLAALSLYVMFNELPILIGTDNGMDRYKSMAWLLVPHALLGSIALVIGPFQFSTRLRAKNIALHKKLGKLYIFSILLATPFAIMINIYYPIPGASNTFVFQNITQALVWGITAVMAWVAASKRQITIHKMWAARSYGVTLVFVLSRIYNPMNLVVENSNINDFAHFLWLLVVLGLIIPDIIIFNKELFFPEKQKFNKDARPIWFYWAMCSGSNTGLLFAIAIRRIPSMRKSDWLSECSVGWD